MTEEEWIADIVNRKRTVLRLRAERDAAAEAQRQAIETYNLAQQAYSQAVADMQDAAQMTSWHMGI